MPLLDEFYESRSDESREVAKKILFSVFGNILGRSGFDHAWDACDADVQEEILSDNLEKIQKELKE